MKVRLLKSFLYYFHLRQGTILIAIVQLVFSGYVLVFFTLGLTHEAGIQEMIARDRADVLEREALEEITSKHINSHRMELAHHNAAERIYLIYCGLVIVIVHFFSTLCLLYGALTNNRYLMTPWMMVMMTIIVALIITLFLVQEDCPFIAMIGGRADALDRIAVLFIAMVNLYKWLVVYSTYRFLEIKRSGIIHEVHTVTEKRYAHASTSKNCINNSNIKKSQRQHISLNEPYDV